MRIGSKNCLRLATLVIGMIIFVPASASAQGLCMDTCPYAFDGECDDGGMSANTSVCAYGTDCGDCGWRGVGTICMNTCAWSYDYECDDGGPGSLNNLCGYGTDCNDCGARSESVPTPVPTPTPTPTYNTGGLCTNTCSWAFDGECDDGGPGSLYDICEYGSDCGDCGVRAGTVAPTPTPYNTGYCTNTCSWAFDGECDDGGPGSLYNICDYGTDCGDCGVRY